MIARVRAIALALAIAKVIHSAIHLDMTPARRMRCITPWVPTDAIKIAIAKDTAHAVSGTGARA